MLNPAELIAATVQTLLLTHSQLSQTAMLYEEKPGGFQCGTCRFAERAGMPDGKARCAIVGPGIIDLHEGCCAAWTADEGRLRAVHGG